MRSPCSRREFLQQSVLTAATLSASSLGWLTACEPRLPRKGRPKDVLIMGAGLAGLTAAYELKRAGHRVTVFETKMRPGGRVETWRSPFADGLYAEAGAGRIPDNHDLTVKYAKAFGLKLEPFFPQAGKFVRYLRQQRYLVGKGESLNLSQLPLKFNPSELKLGLVGYWDQKVTPVVRNIGDPTSPGWPAQEILKYDRMTTREFYQTRGFSEAAMEIMALGSSHPKKSSWSALGLLRYMANQRGKKITYRIQGGNDLLPRAFASFLAPHIHYGTTVIRLEPTSKSIRVVTKRKGHVKSYQAEFVICTLPFSVLQYVEVDPPFSQPKQKAIQEITYTSVTRAILQVKERYWESEGLNGFALTDDPAEIWHSTLNQPGPRGLLASYMRSDYAEQVAALKKSERRKHVTQQFERIYPGIEKYLEGMVTKTWGHGAYSFFKPGQFKALYPHMARPEGRIHFAGDHASPWPAWMQGAIYSGLRVAREVNDAPSRRTAAA